MDTKIDKKYYCKEILQAIKKDCFDKLIGSEIFALTEEDNTKVGISNEY